MDDITDKLTQLLSNPEILKKIKDLSESFGEKKHNSRSKAEEFEEEKKIKDEKKESGECSKRAFPELDSFSPDILETVSNLAPIISSLSQDDKYTKFLHSLKPLLSEQRRQRLEESFKILKLIHILPILKDKNII